MTETTVNPTPEIVPTQAAPAPTGPVLKPPKKKRKWKRWVLLALVLVVAGFIAYGAIAAALAKPVVLYASATREDIDSVISATGSILSEQTKTYFIPATVKVKEVNFRRGDQVQKGDVIATFDLSDLQSSYRKAEIALENATLQYEDTLEDLDDSTYSLNQVSTKIRRANAEMTDLEIAYKYHPDNFGGGSTIDDRDIRTLIDNYSAQELYAMMGAKGQEIAALVQQRDGLRRLDMSDNQLKQLDNNLETLRLQVEDVRRMLTQSQGGLVADFDGVLTQLNLVEGATLTPGLSAAVLEGNQEVSLSFSLNKYDIQRLALGQPATITFGRRTLTGTVVHIDGAATAVGGSPAVLARVLAQDPEHLLKLGMEADLDILADSRKGTVAVPIETVKTDRGGDYVYILTPTTGEKAKAGEFDLIKTYITLGISDDSFLEVLEGVSEGDLVATVVPKGIEGGAVVTGIPGSSSGGMLQLPGGMTVQQPHTME